MKKNYFKGVLGSLKAGRYDKKISHDFVTLKSYEYWIRMMRASKSMPDADDCIAIFTKEAASRVLKDLSEHFEKLNAEEDCITGAARKRFVKEVNGSYAGKRLRCDEDNEEMSVAYQRRQMAVVRFNDVIDRSCSVKEIADFVRNYLCGEGIFDTSSQKVFYESVARELEKVLEENCSVDDGYFRRLNIVQNAFNLSDAEMEIVLFSWIFFNKEQCSSLLDMIGSRRFRGAALPDVFPQLYPDVDFENLVSNKGTLKQMGILDEDLDISKRIGMFLDGHSGNDLDSLYFRVYEGGCVPYKKLCRKDPKVEMAFDMIKHAKVGEGLNIFFYGVEGTGKTELAKAIAKELKRPLVLTNISTEGVHRDSKENSVVRSRMGSILYAATKYQKKKAILLVDESDVILNCCEKGALNFFLEQIKIPVIWISNNIGFIENSTLRRFDYSVRFERPDVEKREQVWQSVVSEQGAGAIISEEELRRFASEFQITAGDCGHQEAAGIGLQGGPAGEHPHHRGGAGEPAEPGYGIRESRQGKPSAALPARCHQYRRGHAENPEGDERVRREVEGHAEGRPRRQPEHAPVRGARYRQDGIREAHRPHSRPQAHYQEGERPAELLRGRDREGNPQDVQGSGREEGDSLPGRGGQHDSRPQRCRPQLGGDAGERDAHPDGELQGNLHRGDELRGGTRYGLPQALCAEGEVRLPEARRHRGFVEGILPEGRNARGGAQPAHAHSG